MQPYQASFVTNKLSTHRPLVDGLVANLRAAPPSNMDTSGHRCRRSEPSAEWACPARPFGLARPRWWPMLRNLHTPARRGTGQLSFESASYVRLRFLASDRVVGTRDQFYQYCLRLSQKMLAVSTRLVASAAVLLSIMGSLRSSRLTHPRTQTGESRAGRLP